MLFVSCRFRFDAWIVLCVTMLKGSPEDEDRLQSAKRWGFFFTCNVGECPQ